MIHNTLTNSFSSFGMIFSFRACRLSVQKSAYTSDGPYRQAYGILVNTHNDHIDPFRASRIPLFDCSYTSTIIGNPSDIFLDIIFMNCHRVIIRSRPGDPKILTDGVCVPRSVLTLHVQPSSTDITEVDKIIVNHKSEALNVVSLSAN